MCAAKGGGGGGGVGANAQEHLPLDSWNMAIKVDPCFKRELWDLRTFRQRIFILFYFMHL